MTSEAAIDALRTRGEVIWENQRYGAVYVVDRSRLHDQLTHHVPVLHLGQPEAISAVRKASPTATWVVVYLWCSRDIAAQRIAARKTGDAEDRLRAWDETKPLDQADLTIDTAQTDPDTAASMIHRIVDARRHG